MTPIKDNAAQRPEPMAETLERLRVQMEALREQSRVLAEDMRVNAKEAAARRNGSITLSYRCSSSRDPADDLRSAVGRRIRRGGA